jgi:class 3 adenylate cyclase
VIAIAKTPSLNAASRRVDIASDQARDAGPADASAHRGARRETLPSMEGGRRHPRSQRTRLRASDWDRERVVESLRHHFEAGRLSEDDLSERIESAYAARTVADLDVLTTDLPSTRTSASRRRHSGAEAGVRVHFTFYLVVNLMLIGFWAAAGGGYFWPIWPILGWGIGLGCHAAPILALRGRRRPAAPALPYEHTRRPRPLHSAETSVDEMASTVAAERPSLRPAAAPDGTVTILFTDIEGSTGLNERLGDVRWLELLRIHNRLVRNQVQAFQGFEVKSQGDGFMIAFPSARRAIQCARAIQEAVNHDLAGHPDGPIRVRIGLHTGEAIREESDFYGRNVVVAARITDVARGGEILASSVVKDLAESSGDVTFEDPREVELAGLAGRHAVYKIA